MAKRYRKSIKLGGGARLNLGKRGVGLSIGGKGFRYSVNSSGRRTSTVSIPGSGLSSQHISTTRCGASGTRAAAEAGSAATPKAAKPGLFAKRDEKALYRVLKAAARTSVEQWAPQLEVLAGSRRVGNAANALGGVLLYQRDPARAFTALQAALRSGAEPAAAPFIYAYERGYGTTFEVDGVGLWVPMSRACSPCSSARCTRAAARWPWPPKLRSRWAPTG